MSEMSGPLAAEKELYIKQLKRSFDRWREMILFLHSVLLWKKKAYPWIILACVTFLFVEIAVYDLSVVTIVSLLLLFFTLADFLGPIIANAVIKEEWTATKQRDLEETCKTIAGFMVAAKVYYTSLLEVKASKPNLYYSVTLTTLALLAWIGNSVNNLFISYLIVLSLTMLPGIIQLGLVQKYFATLMSQDFVKNFVKTKTQ